MAEGSTPSIVVEDYDNASSERRPLFRNQVSENSEEDSIVSPETPPKDNHKIVWVIFFLVGMTTLLPWNFFISLNNFWDYKFRNVSKDASVPKNNSTAPTELQKEFTSYLAIASNVPNATFVLLNAVYGQRFDLRKRIVSTLSMIIAMFVCVSALSFANSDSWQRPFLATILLFVVIINICSAIFQGGAFGYAGKFPPEYMGAQMAGQAMGGIFPALVDITIVALDVKEKDVGPACFVVATVVLVICLMSQTWMFRSSPFFKFYNDGPPTADEEEPSSSRDFSSVTVVKNCWLYLLTVFITFTCTLSIFPPVAVLVQAETYASGSSWAVKYFTPVSVFLLFNVGDFVGRTLASWIRLPSRSTLGKVMTLSASIARLAFIPLFMHCNIPGNPERKVVFRSDADFIAFMVLFSVSNGYIGNICMLNGPKGTQDREMKEAIAMFLIAGLVLGAGTGSFLSYPLVRSL